MNNRIYLSVLILPILVATLFSCSSGSDKQSQQQSGEDPGCKSGQITVYGEAPIYTSVATSRSKATEDACRTAVAKCIGEEVSRQTGVGDAQSLGIEIYSSARGICRNQQIIEEEQYKLDTVNMMRLYVRFTVTPQAIDQKITDMQQFAGNPKIMVLIREELNMAGKGKRVMGFTDRNGKASAFLKEYLTGLGYSIIDPSRLRASFNEEAIAENPNNISEDLMDKIMEAGADVLVVGTVEATPQDVSMLAGSDFKSYRSTANISIITLWGNSRTLGEFANSSNGAHISEIAAAQKAVERLTVGTETDWRKKPGGLAKFTHERLSQEWSKITRNNEILIKIQGLEKVDAATFHDDLVATTNVRRVNEISFSPTEIVWEVVYPGRAFALADTLAFYGEDPRMFNVVKGGKRMKVTNVKRGEIKIAFQ